MKYTYLLLFFFITYHANSQDTIITYFDSKWEKCKENNASYYRKAYKTDQKSWIVNDYYLNGQLQMTGRFTKRNAKIKHGHFIYYNENGQKKSEGNFIDDYKMGRWTTWHENGNIDSEGEFENGKRENTWYWYFENGQISAKEKYLADEKIEWEFWDETGDNVDLIDAEHYPQFKGGWDELYAFLNKNINYPEGAKSGGLQVMVIVEFIVLGDGGIEQVSVTTPDPLIYSSFAIEVIRVMQLLPKFTPGKQHNRPIKVAYRLPITFKL